MKLRDGAALLAFSLCTLGLFATEHKTQPMRVTALEYHKRDASAPYRLEGETLPPNVVLYYVLDCKKGAANLHVGESYQVLESTDENGMKNLLIYYTDPDDPSIIGVFCTVDSVKTKK